MSPQFRSNVILGAAIFIVVLPYCFFGFDVTDYGYIVYEQKVALKSILHTFVSDQQIPLSLLIGGVLQKISFTGTLLAMKIITLLLMIANALIALKITKIIFHDNDETICWRSLTVIFSFSFVMIGPLRTGAILVPSYDTIPPTVCLLLILSLVKFLQTDRKRFLFLSYLLFITAVLCKITLIIAILLFLLLPCYTSKKQWKDLKWQLLGIAMLTVFTAFYTLYFLKNQTVELTPSYDKNVLLKIYLRDFLYSFRQITFFSILLLIGISLGKKRKSLFFIFIGILGALILYAQCLELGGVRRLKLFIDSKNAFSFSVVLFCAFISIILYFMNRKSGKLVRFALVAAILLPFFLCAGGNTGLSKMGYGIILMPPMIILSLRGRDEAYSRIMFTIFIFIGFFGFVRLYTAYYRDSINPIHMTTTIHHPKLIEIRTTQSRRDVYEELLDESRKYIHPDDLIFAYDCNPMLYWLTDTIAFEQLSWPDMFTKKVLEDKMRRVCTSNENMPVIIVRSLVTTRDRDWPNEKPIPLKPDKQEKLDMMDRYVQQNCLPKKVWSNKAFEIWLPEKQL